MKIYQDTAGQLKCRFVSDLSEQTPPRLLVILNHGFGAPADDLVDLAPWLMENEPELADHCVFVFPAAPIDLGPMGMPGGRAWWPINMAALAEINQTRDYAQLTRLRPEGMLEAADLLLNSIRALQTRFGVGDSATVPGGFSQGAMVSTEVTLRHGLCPALLALFSGTLLCRDEWSEMAQAHPGCAVLQSHGTQDPVLPFEPAVELHDLLSQNGFETEFIRFAGPHTIPAEALERTGLKLRQILQAISS